MFLFSYMALFLYVLPYFTLWDSFKKMGLVSEEYLGDFYKLIFFCFGAFVLGDAIIRPQRFALVLNEESQFTKVINPVRYEQYAIIIGAIGVLGYGYFIISSGGTYFLGHNSGNYSVGGYIYELRYFIFSAVLLLYNARLQKVLSQRGFYVMIFLCFFLAYDAYIQQQRGSWIRFGVIFIFSYLFYKRETDKINIVALFNRYTTIFLAGVFMIFLLTFTVQVRKYYSPNTSFTEQVSQTVKAITQNPDLLFGGSALDEGNEYVVAYNAFMAADVSGVYDMGKKWLYPFMNFIPRTLWDDKPYWETYSIDIFEYIDKYSLIRHAPGSAETGVVDAFYRFSWYAPLFFFILGIFSKRLQLRSMNDLPSRNFYICFYIGIFYFFTQNMMPFVIFTLYMFIPVWFVNKTCFRTVDPKKEEAYEEEELSLVNVSH